MDFKLILAFVDDDHADRVLDAAREAGATGATIVNNAQGQGLKKRFGLFGLEVLDPRSVVSLPTSRPFREPCRRRRECAA